MSSIPKETLEAYLDDALSDAETAEVERVIRTSEAVRKELHSLMQCRDRGEHSVGAIWRRHRLSCPNREQLGSYLLGAMDAELHDYIEFHLQTIGCSACLANLTDLQSQRAEEATHATKRRKRYYDSTAGLLRPARP
jgi:hypothetical protein